jgi:hypothetical protein
MDRSKLLPGGEIHARRIRPTPAFWKPLETIVPAGAPAAAISPATAFVDVNSL